MKFALCICRLSCETAIRIIFLQILILRCYYSKSHVFRMYPNSNVRIKLLERIRNQVIEIFENSKSLEYVTVLPKAEAKVS